MKKFRILILVFVSLLTTTQVKIFACSCPSMGETLEQNIKAHLKNDEAIFVGKLLNIDDKSVDGDRLVKFQVEEFWKGKLSGEIIISTENERSSCAYPFEKDKTYLIYVNIYNKKLYTGGCIPDREVSRASEELKILGKGTKPEKDTSQIK